MPAAMPRSRPEMERMLERICCRSVSFVKGNGCMYASVVLYRVGDQRVEQEGEFLWRSGHGDWEIVSIKVFCCARLFEVVTTRYFLS